MYSLTDITKGIRDPYLLFREIDRQYYNLKHPGGIDIFDEDWDNLIILDACRADVFEAHTDFPGETSTKISKGSQTSEFIRSNFSDRSLHDTVYVTGNSWILKIGDDIGADLYAVYDAKNDFDYEQKEITEQAIEAAEKHPDKRVIVHFIPPHHPFIGPTAEEEFPSLEEQESDFFRGIRKGEYEIDDELLKQVYIENLERVIPRVEELLGHLRGKTVITSDHGELLGDRLAPLPIKGYGHPRQFYAPELVTVPWHVYLNGEPKTITEDTPIEDDIDSRSPEEIDEQLRSLGYKI